MNTLFSHIESADLTDVGLRRKNNEDSLLRLPDFGVYCVADGMGGVKGGEMASKAVVETLGNIFTNSADARFAVTAAASGALIRRALNDASRWIKRRAEELGLSGTGSTAVVLAFDGTQPDKALVLHAGDSRVYRWRNGKLTQLSADHSVAAAAGLSDERDLPAMFRGVITRAVGLAESVELEATAVEVAASDLFLLCSDGLSKMATDKRIAKLLRKHEKAPLAEMARALVDEALHAGGEDNVSVVLVQISGVLPKPPTLEIAARTRQLESESNLEVSALKDDGDDAERETGQTAVTGHTIDTAKFAGEGVTPSEMTDGTVPPQATVVSESAPRKEEEDVTNDTHQKEEVAGAERSATKGVEQSSAVQKNSARQTGRIWLFLVLLAVLAVLLLLYFNVK